MEQPADRRAALRGRPPRGLARDLGPAGAGGDAEDDQAAEGLPRRDCAREGDRLVQVPAAGAGVSQGREGHGREDRAARRLAVQPRPTAKVQEGRSGRVGKGERQRQGAARAPEAPHREPGAHAEVRAPGVEGAQRGARRGHRAVRPTIRPTAKSP